MALTLSNYFDIIRSSAYKTRARVSFLRSEDETPFGFIEGDIIDGNLQITRHNGVRRSCNIKLVNEDKKYIPNPYGIWVNRKFLLELGVESLDQPGEVFYIPQGVFVMRNPTITSSNDHSVIDISGIDKFSLLDGQLGGRLDSTFIFEEGSDINADIRSILALSLDSNAQFPIDAKSPILQDLPLDKSTSPYTLRRDLGGNLADVLLEINGFVSRNMFYNPLGHFVFQDDFEDIDKGSIWDYSQDDFTYLGSTHEYRFEDLHNKVIVVSDNVDGGTYIAEAVNTNPASRTNINAIGVKIAEPIFDNVIDSEDLAQQRADYELRRVNALQSAVTIKSIPMFHIDVDRMVTLTDDRLRLDKERFVIQDINIPLRFGSEITVSAVKSSELDF